METRVIHATDANGHPVEVATIIHEGHEFTALGSCLDPERPVVYCMGNHQLTTWEGAYIGWYEVTRTYRNNFGARIDCITANIDGTMYYGRKSHDWSDLVFLHPRKS